MTKVYINRVVSRGDRERGTDDGWQKEMKRQSNGRNIGEENRKEYIQLLSSDGQFSPSDRVLETNFLCFYLVSQ